MSNNVVRQSIAQNLSLTAGANYPWQSDSRGRTRGLRLRRIGVRYGLAESRCHQGSSSLPSVWMATTACPRDACGFGGSGDEWRCHAVTPRDVPRDSICDSAEHVQAYDLLTDSIKKDEAVTLAHTITLRTHTCTHTCASHRKDVTAVTA